MLSSLRNPGKHAKSNKFTSKCPFVIPLEPVQSQAVKDAETITFKLWSQSKETKSQTYKMTACVFTTGTPAD